MEQVRLTKHYEKWRLSIDRFEAIIDEKDNVDYVVSNYGDGTYDRIAGTFNIDYIYELENVVEKFMKNKNVYSLHVPGFEHYDITKYALYDYALQAAKGILVSNHKVDEVMILKNGVELKRVKANGDPRFIITDCDD